MLYFIKIEYENQERTITYPITHPDIISHHRTFILESKFTGWINWYEIIDNVEDFYLREYFVNGECHNEKGPALYTKMDINFWRLNYSLDGRIILQKQWLDFCKLQNYKESFEKIIND